MPELLPQPPQLVTTQAPTPGVSPSEVAQPYRELADTFKEAGGAAESLAETSARYEGLQAGTNAKTNPDGTVEIPKAPIIGPASQDYEQAVKMGVLAKAEGDVKDATRKLMVDHLDDPEGYRQAINAFRDKTISQYGNAGAPDVGLALGRAIDSSSEFTYRMLLNQQREVNLREAWQNIQDGRTQASDDLHALYRNGAATNPNDPRVIQAWDKWNSLTAHAVANPAIGYSSDKAQFDTEQLRAQLQGDTFLHHIDQIYGDQSVGPDGKPLGGAGAALGAAQSILTDPDVRLSPAQRQQFYAKAVGEVRANEAIRHQSIGEAREAETSLDQGAYLGAPVDPQQVESVASAYRAAGDPAAAARLYAKYARKPLNDDFGKQPFPDQLDQLRALTNGANPTTTAEAALINHESGGDPRLVNRYGYAGLYQFGAPNLADLGLYKPGAGENVHDPQATGGWSGQKWSGTFNIPGFPEVKTLRDFLGNPAAQKAAFNAHTTDMDAQIQGLGLDKYIGQTVGGVPITRAGLHAMIHLGGAEGTRVALQTNGAVNPRDPNGTSLLDYARMGAQNGTPSANMWLATNRAREIDSEARASWKTLTEDYDKDGMRPADAVLNQLVTAAHLAGDSDLLDAMASGIGRMDAAQRFAQEPLPAQGADLGTLQQGAATGLLQPGQSGVLKDLQRKHQAIVEGLDKNPITTTVANFGDRFAMPGPLNLADPDALAGGLQQRAKIAQFARQNWQTGPVSALDDADLKQVQGALAGAQPQQKAAIFAGLSTLPPDVLGATLKKLGGDSPVTMAEAAAGSMVRNAPDIASSIFRGMAAIEGTQGEPKPGPTTKVLDPSAQGKANFSTDFAKALPSATFTAADRADPTGPYATMQMMVRARYADLAAKAGDSEYSAARVAQAVADVTGGVLYQSGAPLIAPARGMTQGRFDAVMGGITDRDLQGVTDANGRPITADYLRQSRLQSVGDGRYWVNLGNKGDLPVYAYVGANSEAPSRFVLDLRGRQPAANMPDTQFVPQTVQP